MTTLRTDSTHSSITIAYANGSGFVHGGSGPLTVYSDDEKAAINALTDANDDTYYLFLVSSVTKLDADGNNTVVSGYMPVGYQHGFIFEQFDVARTIAHELSHGAFALHHTFSANTESFHADEGTTNNLMDYTEHGIALNHKQWRWMHENHGKGLFGFLADEEEGENLLSKPAIFTYLELIHDANAKNQKQLAIPKTDVYSEREDIQLGDVGKLTFIRIGDITNGKKEEQPLILFYGYNNIFIKPNEISETEIMKDDVKYTKYTFHLAEGVKIPTTEPELTETVALEIMVKSSEKDILKDYIFTNWEYLMTKDRLTVAQIAIARDGISKVINDDERGRLFQSLQTKVPYHSQRDNDPTYKNKTKEETVKTKKERQYEADRMCNVTSLAMAFEMLGVSKEDAIEKLKEDFDTNDINNIADKDFEDIIDFIRAKKAFTYTYTDKNNKTVEAEALNRTDAILWKLVANYLGISTEGAEEVNSSDINSNKWKIHKPIIEKALKEGDGVVLSLFRTKGHIVRLQSISNEGIVIDDPFGKLTSMAKRELPLDDPKGNYTSNDVDMTKKEGQRGKDVELTWNEINVGVDDSGCGGEESMDGSATAYTTTVNKETIIHTVIEWANEISPCEYMIEEKEVKEVNEEKEVKEVNEEKEEKNEEGENYQSKIVKCYGGMVKFYLIFKKQ